MATLARCIKYKRYQVVAIGGTGSGNSESLKETIGWDFLPIRRRTGGKVQVMLCNMSSHHVIRMLPVRRTYVTGTSKLHSMSTQFKQRVIVTRRSLLPNATMPPQHQTNRHSNDEHQQHQHWYWQRQQQCNLGSRHASRAQVLMFFFSPLFYCTNFYS